MKKQKDDMQVNVAGLRRNIKNLAHNYSDAQVKVREATSNDPWGPSATIMAEIADLTYNVVAFSEIMQMIWKRLNDHGKNWRHVYKALILLEYLIKTGTEKVAQQCKENIFAIQTLREFVYFEEGKDQGTHVREKAKQLVTLLKDDERLKNERVKALKAKERFSQHPSGFGSDGYIDGPSQRDMPPGWQEEPKPVSELEMVRPQTAGEEELQLQLAMAMSREEAEQEEAKRRSDDVRLQLALSQSEQDFKDQTVVTGKRNEPQSHLLDLLDISLGATSISSPPLGAAGGDPWGTPARAGSQLSDPWSGTSSPPIDPWQPSALRSNAGGTQMSGAMVGATNGDSWALRTQSPSVASGSSTEGWLQNNGTNGLNGNTIAAATPNPGDPWYSKTTNTVPVASTTGVYPNLDPWLAENNAKLALVSAAPPAVQASEKSLTLDDPWAPKTAPTDPWKTLETTTKKPSPDIDEFDIITNRNKTGDLLTNNSNIGFNNNNNATLLDDMDPLSELNSTNLSATMNQNKKPLKTPQAFLGENSSLVNLDNLIKPVTLPQTAAYNPFSDTIIQPQPKTNLFQQQQPAVPSINQLKQQQPFTMTVNQDPWAPVNNSGVTSQRPNYDFFCNEETITTATITAKASTTTLKYSSNTTNTNNFMHYSKSDYDVFNTSNVGGQDFFNTTTTTVATASTINNNGIFNVSQINTTANRNYSQSVDNIRNMEIVAEVKEPNSATTRKENVVTTAYNPLTHENITYKNQQHQQATHDYRNNNYNTYGSISNLSYPYPLTQSKVTAPTQTASTANYSNALSASLNEIPGVRVKDQASGYYGQDAGLFGANKVDGFGRSASMYNYGFYNGNTANSAGPCKVENNNMPWIKPEAAASNPFLS